ncbi:SAM-dependent methyltransferase, partial [Niveispirillum fermenti]|uniref:SAM-dependent methyltransferase n=1 Tax=Niveispirillum fermenti TaxID=1233113 RepID=UPI003A8A32E2
MPNSIDVSKPIVAGQTHGSLTVVGTGIRSISHFTQEAVGHIRDADTVFFAVPDGVTANFIRELNPNAYNLALHYGEDKRRLVTYVQMAELILRAVREGKRVTAVFYGHPGFFVSPARRALNIARKEGHRTELLPGISSTDYLFADLRIDPSIHGCQIVDASDMLLRNRPLLTSSHVVLLQVGSVGDSYFSARGFKNNKRAILFERLIEIYGENHPSYHYVGATFPGLDSQIIRRPLKAYRDPAVRASVHQACSFYLPPKDVLPLDPDMMEKFGMRSPGGAAAAAGDTVVASPAGDYGPFEMDAVARLEKEPLGGRERRTSKTLCRILAQLAANPVSAEAFRRDPDTYVGLFSGLTAQEKSALIGRSATALHSVSLQIVRPIPTAVKADATEQSDGGELHDGKELHDGGELHDGKELHDGGE